MAQLQRLVFCSTFGCCAATKRIFIAVPRSRRMICVRLVLGQSAYRRQRRRRRRRNTQQGDLNRFSQRSQSSGLFGRDNFARNCYCSICSKVDCSSATICTRFPSGQVGRKQRRIQSGAPKDSQKRRDFSLVRFSRLVNQEELLIASDVVCGFCAPTKRERETERKQPVAFLRPADDTKAIVY